MNKKIKVTSAAAAALASLVLVNANVNNEVKADTKAVNDTKTTQKAQTPEEAARANVASAKKKVETEQGNVDKAQGDLDQAKKDAEKPDADYKAQSDKVDGLKKTVDQKNEALTDAKNKEKDAQALADEANDPAKVQAAKEAVTKQNGVVKNANDAKDKADQAVKDKQKEIDDLGKDVKTDTQDVNDKTAAKKQADQDVTDAEDALKGTGITEAKKELDAAKEAVAKTQKALKEANDAINQANGDKTAAQKAWATAQTAHDTAVTNQKIAQKAYDDAKAASDTADKKFANKKAEVKKLRSKLHDLEINSQNKIVIPNIDYYKSMLKDYINQRALTSDQINYLNSARKQVNYISSDKDKKITVDLKNLTDDQIKDLSLFALSLTNEIRSQFGFEPAVVTNGGIEVAKELAQKYEEDFKNTIPAWHDDVAIKKVVNEHRIGLGEAMAPKYVSSSQTNMDNLKRDVFNMFRDMVFSKGNGIDEKGGQAHYELGHAMIVIGAKGLMVGDNPTVNIQDANDRTIGERLILKNWQKEVQTIKDKIKELELHEQNSEIKNKIELQKESLISWEGNVKKLEQRIKNETHPLSMVLIPTDYGYDPTEYQEAIEYHYYYVVPSTDSKFDQTIIPSYASQINDLNKKLGTINGELSGLESEAERLDGITSGKLTDLSNKNTAVKGAQDSIDKANKDIKKANDTLTKVENALDQAQNVDLPKLQKVADQKDKDTTQAQTKLEELQKHVEDLKNAKTILANAKHALTDAQTAYDTAKNNYDDANKVLNGDLKTNKDAADAKVVAAQKAYDEAVAKLQAAKDALAKAQQKLQDILDAEYAQSIITSGLTETKKTDKQEPVKIPEATPETKTDDISTTPKKIRLTHNAFVYNKHGKLIRKGLHIKWIKRDKLVKVLKNAKIVKINGKRYYQIGRNKFVKVANFEITTHAVHFTARLKGNKKVRAYNRSGKFNKHYARPNHTYTFNEKAKINGKTYYKIAGTNNWIPAKKLALKK
ncbi:SEC10/PgrA surface exclusion domain-containing protein [Lactobacillus gallinarum]|uniref:SEC10/PgrA surface exclusion domain-containing protein n=1 Tax=Lactobacillus gallinarum TaxID=52242 RepID=UPI000B3823D8|nr:SEC10/PgrA surface exclusion domain-containing protein [Lactobacillus gallinarum]OUQ48776.1 hypothetical protein B5E63_05405 [Lactobacillus gallinarum]